MPCLNRTSYVPDGLISYEYNALDPINNVKNIIAAVGAWKVKHLQRLIRQSSCPRNSRRSAKTFPLSPDLGIVWPFLKSPNLDGLVESPPFI